MSPFEAASSISLKSELTPDIPKTPDFLFKDSETSSIVYPHSSTKKGIIDGSILPDLVPIGIPASGVNPIVVSIHCPPFIADILAPFPKWHVIIFKSFISFPIASATL